MGGQTSAHRIIYSILKRKEKKILKKTSNYSYKHNQAIFCLLISSDQYDLMLLIRSSEKNCIIFHSQSIK